MSLPTSYVNLRVVVVVRQKHGPLTISDEDIFQVQPIPAVSFVHGAGAMECLTTWAGITLAITDDLACATAVGAQAMGCSLSRHGAQDSMPYPSELPVSWPAINLGGYRGVVT
jgi:fructose-1-phosphate kinase PfkB-like protein